MANSIIVFTLNGCSHCVQLKKRLNEENISFTEVEVGKNPKIWDQVVEQTQHNTLPTVYIRLDDGDSGPVFVPERDYKDKEDLINKIKKYI